MTTMNSNEREQRLKQIRERWSRMNMPQTVFTSHCKGDIDFLLSLLDSEGQIAAATPTTPSAAAMRAAEVKVVLERVARCVYIDEPPCWCNESNDENVEHDTNCLVARDYWASLTILHSTDDALANEVQSRVNLVAEAAVEWYQAGREGGECFDAAEKLSATINSLLELRSKPDAAASSETETEHERLRRTFAYERVRFHHDPNNTYLVVNVTNENMLELEGMAGEFAPSLFKKVGGKETTPFVAATPSPETAIDLARADGYNDGFRQGRQSRATTPPDTPSPLTPEAPDLLWVNPEGGFVANHQAGSAFLPYRRVVDGSVVAATRATEELLRENFLLSDVTADEFNKIAAIITRRLAAPVVVTEAGFLRDLCIAIVAGERDAKEGQDVVTVGIYRELFDKCRAVAVGCTGDDEGVKRAVEEIDELLSVRLPLDVYVEYSPANQEVAAIITKYLCPMQAAVFPSGEDQ